MYRHFLPFVVAFLSFNSVECQPPSTLPINATPLTERSALTPVFSEYNTAHTERRASNDIDTVLDRRLSQLVRGITNLADIPDWLSTLGADGMWPTNEVDYTSGCKAQRANWPAQKHWNRLNIMAAAWHGGTPDPDGGKWANNQQLLDAISRAMNYWFDHDYKNSNCLSSGGKSACPCDSDPGFWSTNWYSNLILIPRFVGRVCLLMEHSLGSKQLSGCNTILSRAYDQFDRNIPDLGYLTGANTLDVASLSIDFGLLGHNITVIQHCYDRVHKEMAIQDTVKDDGIRRDGAFSQHRGVLYNGNYGKDYLNDVLAMEVNAGETQFSAGSEARNAFSVLVDADQWMISQNTVTGVLHWDFSALGRFISFPVADAQATGSMGINLTDVNALGEVWGSESLKAFAANMNKDTSNANVGDLRGNRMFYTSDYMVQRGPGYITSLKMFSPRTKNTECLNSENPLGFHLSDGIVHTYLNGNEYEDIAASWDWNLIPGTTVDYGETPLKCTTGQYGLEAFVGGVSDGQAGLAAMRYTNPVTRNITWQKAWFFLDNDVQMVLLSDFTAKSPNVVSVLDQKRKNGPFYVDGVNQENYHHTNEREFRHGKRSHHRRRAVPIADNRNISRYTSTRSLWHGNVGYVFEPLTLSVQTGEKSGDWSKLGISKQPPTVVDLFTAWIDQTAKTLSYMVYPGTTYDQFKNKASSAAHYKVVQNDKHSSAVLDGENDVAMVVFWNDKGGSITIPPCHGHAGILVTVDANSVLLYRIGSGEVTVSDPSQTKTKLKVRLEVKGAEGRPKGFEGQTIRNLDFQLPVGGMAGSGVRQML